MRIFVVDVIDVGSFVPAHPERTAFDSTNPMVVYYREFDSRREMDRWHKRQSWEQKRTWRPWMASEANRRLLVKSNAQNRKARAAALYEQESLFA